MKRTPTDRGRLARLQRTCQRYRVGKSAGEFFTRIVRLSTPVFVGVATLVFLSKLLWPPLMIAVAVVPLWLLGACLALLWIRSRWRVPGWRASAVTDYHTGNSGLYMALEEAEGGDWPERLAEGEVPVRGGVPRRSVATALALVAALTVVCLLPDLRPPVRPRGGSVTPVKKLAELVQVLEADELADPEYLKETKELLEKLRQREEEAGRMSPEDWQALDGCREELRRQTTESFRKLEAARIAAQELANKVEQGEPLSKEECERAAELLKQFGEQALAGGDRPPNADGLPQDGAPQDGLPRDGLPQLSPEMLERLAQQLGDCPGGQMPGFSPGELESLQALLEGIEGELGEPGEACQGVLGESGLTPDELAALLQAGGMPAIAAGTIPGRGAPTRGPGAAALQHVGKTDENVGKFQAETFRGRRGDATVDVGQTVAAPDESDARTGKAVAGGAVRQFGPGNERLTWRTRLLPRHSRVLKEYFRSEDD